MIILVLIAFLLYWGVFAFKAATGGWVMKPPETVVILLLYELANYVFLAAVFGFPLPLILLAGWRNPVVSWVGAAVMWLGNIAYIILAVDFGRYFKIGVDQNSEGLKTDGLHGVSRNPMYVAFFVFWFGGLLVAQSLGTLLVFLGVVLSFWIIVRFKEEPFLRERYGAEYEEYCRRVRRWV